MNELELETAAVELKTPAGILRVLADDQVVRARGVRYGTAARFAVSEPVGPWEGVVDATKRGPAAPQPLETEFRLAGAVAEAMDKSEDCLTLAVTAPAGAKDLPVIVFFHGGSYINGAGDAPRYDPTKLALEGKVVVVSVTARLGILGYLPPQSAGEMNLGLRDQLLALRWVHEQISAFGGDPDRVTLWGQSAGADTVLTLCLVPGAEVYFKRVIVVSPPLPLRQNRGPLNVEMRRRVEAEFGPDPYALSTQEILDMQERLSAGVDGFGLTGQVPFGPVFGETPLPADGDLPPSYAAAAKRFELLMGTTKHDALSFAQEHPLGIFLSRFGAPGRALVRALTRPFTRKLFSGPAEALVERWRSDGGRAKLFRLDWYPPGSELRACHCIDLPLLLGDPVEWADARMLDGRPPDEAVGAELRRAWAAFAYGGVDALPSSSPLVFG